MGMKELFKLATEFLIQTKFANIGLDQPKPLVLCVEDDEDILAMLKHMLEGRGYRVLAASNVEQALAFARKHDDIHSLITDYYIHGGTAAELIAALGDRKPKNVVLLSGKHFSGDPKKEVPGINSHVSKPFNFKKLIEKIDVNDNQVDDR